MQQRTFVIAEAGVNHNGSIELAEQLVDIAAGSGADAVKFQTFRAATLVTPTAKKAEYQSAATGDGSQYEMLSRLELSESDHKRLIARCAMKQIEFMSTPFDEQAADMLVDLGVRRLKVPSGELTNLPFLRYLAAKDLPLIVSTGMGTLEEVGEAVTTIQDVHRSRGNRRSPGDMITILHCTSNYPARPEDVNLRAMGTMQEAFGLEVGYSDHTSGTTIAVAAVAQGASMIEKHFTISRSMEGPDHAASLEPGELTQMVASIRMIEAALGDGEKRPTPSELPMRDVARRSVAASRDLEKGTRITGGDLTLLRPGTGIPPREIETLLGRVIANRVEAMTLLSWSDLER